MSRLSVAKKKALYANDRRTFGSNGIGRFPRVKVEVQGDGSAFVYVWNNRREYESGYPHMIYAYTPLAVERLAKALTEAVPAAKREAAGRRKRRQRHNKLHPTYVQDCILCRVRITRKRK